jgi:hypothetical protein
MEIPQKNKIGSAVRGSSSGGFGLKESPMVESEVGDRRLTETFSLLF